MRVLICLLGLLFVTRFAHATVIPSDADSVKSLDGTWRFKLEQAHGASDTGAADWGKHPIPVDYPQDFEPFFKVDYQEDNKWSDIKVPGNWEMSGHSPATYNQPDNASGFYRLWVEIPKSWEGKVVRLNFDGVQNGAEIWLNGQPVKVDEPSWGRENYHEGGWTAFQVDLTPAVKFGEKNLLALRVTKNTKSVELDTGDYFFLGGVHRPVTLFAVPKTHVEDFKVETKANGEVTIAVKVEGSGLASGSIGGQLMKIKDGKLHAVISNPRLWSAEHPNLYDLVIVLFEGDQVVETVRQRIGIREVTIKDAVLLLNGKPIKMAGMCRHDVSANEGTAVGPELWRKDIELMKAANINAIRTSHYPYGKGFYELCDELGMYVADELPYCWTPTDDKEMEPAFTQRARETVRRDKNHPCVIVWAIGNENKEGQNLQTVADLVKQMDDTRPRAVSWFGAAKYKTELSDSHYTVAKQIEESAIRAKEVGHPHIYLENPNNWEVRLAADPSCWDAWAAVLQRGWAIETKYDTLPGAFLWEWQDRAVADKSPTKLYYYDEKTGINLLKIKGIVDAWRNPRPWYYHVKMIYSPIVVGEKLSRNEGDVSFDVENRFSFTDLSQIKATWQLIADGKTIASGEFTANVPAIGKGKVSVKLPEAIAGADALRIDFTHPSGRHIVAHQFVLKEPKPTAMPHELPKEIAFPQFNLITRLTQADKKVWRKVTRFHAKLIDVKQDARTLDANIVMDNEPEKVVGKVHAGYDDGNKFSYRVDWSGPKAEVQEIGWIFSEPKSHDRFSWQRDALWSVYPDDHIGRASGTARPDSMDVSLTKITRPDAFDFNSTKYNCRWATLADEKGEGLRVEFEPDARHHCRGGVGEKGCTLAVNKQVSPPDDISSRGVRDLYMTLNPGDKVESSFRVGAATKAVAAAGAAPKPHIVLFIADDYSWHDCSVYGATDVRTPKLEQLAREGMKFNSAFAASPTCTPSRSAMYTGLYPMRNGAHANHSLINDGLRTLPMYMKNLGYRVVIAGKTHIGPRESFPFEYLPDSNIMPPGKNHVLWTDLNTKAVDELLAKHDVNQPLCLIVCSHSPHVYWPENDGYNPASLVLPPNLLDTTLTRYERCKYYADVSHMDEQVGEVRGSLAKHGFADNTLFMFTADQGAQWPFEKWTLYDGGIRTPLLVTYPGKAKSGAISEAMVSLIDLLPTIIGAAGGSPADDLDGKSFLPVLFGESNHHRDEIYAAHTGDREMNHAPMRCIRTSKFKYISNLAPQIRYTTHISEGEDRDGRGYWASWLRLAEKDAEAAKVIDRFHNLPAEQLFDVENDPYELKNLASDPKYKETLEQLREKLKQWRIQQGEDLNKVPMPEDARTGDLKYAG